MICTQFHETKWSQYIFFFSVLFFQFSFSPQYSFIWDYHYQLKCKFKFLKFSPVFLRSGLFHRLCTNGTLMPDIFYTFGLISSFLRCELGKLNLAISVLSSALTTNKVEYELNSTICRIVSPKFGHPVRIFFAREKWTI